MSALSTPGGGGTTAQSKPASGKQKYQKLDINSLYCANRNENSEPSSVKSQLSRKHGMQSLGKVPSARRPPANLPSLKTETGQDPNSNSISATTTTTVSTPATCTSQTITTSSSSGVVAGTGPGGWVPLPPPSSPHFRTEFPSLEAAAQPSHRSSEHSGNQPQLRPQTEGSWTCGGGVAVRGDSSGPAAAPASTPASQQTPAFRAILPSFLMKGSSGGGGLGLGTLGNIREGRGGGGGGSGSSTSVASRGGGRAPATPRAVEVLTARPILREDQISSLDDISRDAGWAQHDDIDYDQKLDFSDGESSGPSKTSNKVNNRASHEHERIDSKILEPGDEDQIWAERRQKQNNEVAQAVARARQRKEEEQRRQMRDTAPVLHKDSRDRIDRGERDRNDNRDREPDARDKERMDRERERPDNRERDRLDNRDKDRERSDPRDKDPRDKERLDRDRERFDNRDRDVRDRDRDVRDRDRDRDRIEGRDRGRMENRERQDNDKDRVDARDRDRNDRDRADRDRFDRERDRADRDRNERDRDFRERDRDYGRDRDQNNPAFSKMFQANIPPRFLKQQQNRQQDDQHKAWAFPGKPAPRRQEPPSYNAPRHAPHNGGRRSYSRDYSDREDDFRRDKEGSGPQWRSEMHEYDRPRELDRSNSKDSYKDYGDYKDRRNDSDRKSAESTVEHTSSRTAADKLTEVFERKSIGLTEPFASSDSSIQTQGPERRNSNVSQRESSERDFGKTSWADVIQDDANNLTIQKSTHDKGPVKDTEHVQDSNKKEAETEVKRIVQQPTLQQSSTIADVLPSQTQPVKTAQINTHNVPLQNSPSTNHSHSSISDSQTVPKPANILTSKPMNQNDNISASQPVQKISISEHTPAQIKPTFAAHKSEKELSESESIASKSSTDPSSVAANKVNETHSVESLQVGIDSQKRTDDKRNERFSNEQLNRIPGKDPIERKSSGSGSEKKGRGYGGGYSVYVRGWGGPRESRGRRSHRNSRSKNRASESDGSTDGAANAERKERRRAPRSPRGPKKQVPDDGNRPPQHEQPSVTSDGMENREPFAPRGQPSRRGRGGFQGTSRPPAPAKRVTGYGPPNTKSPFSQAHRAVKDNEEVKDGVVGDDKAKIGNKNRTGSQTGRGRDRRPKGAGGPLSGEDENWETTSEHSEGGGTIGRRRSVGGRPSGQSQKIQGGRNQNSNNRQNNNRNAQAAKKDTGDNKTGDLTEAINELKISTAKKDEETVDDGFQEVRNKKNSKDTRGPSKEESQHAQKQRSHSNQGGRNGSSSRNPNDKSNARGSAPVPGKQGGVPQYDRPRQTNLAPRFVKQRQKQMGLVAGFGPDTGAAPPPPAVNAWDKPISQTLRGNAEEPAEVVDNKSGQSSQRSTPGDATTETKIVAPCAIAADKTGVLDGTTPPVETIIFENTNYKTAPPAEALKQKHQPGAITTAKPPTPGEEIPPEVETRPLPFNGDVRPRPRSIQELIGDNARPTPDSGEAPLGLPISFDPSQKTEDSSDMKLDFAFDSDLGQLEDKSAKALGLPRGTHMSTSNTISPLAADLNLKIASVKKVWEMPAVAEGTEELQFTNFEETNTETGAAPNVCKVKPTQQLQSPPPQQYNHVGYQGGYGGLSVPSPPAVLFNSSQQLLGSSQQLQQQGGLYGAFLDQSRGQFGGFPGTPYGAGSATPYNYQPPPDMFQSLPSQYRMAAAASGGAAFGQSGQLGNSPNTVLISSSTNSLMSATVKPSSQQIGAIGSKGGGVGGVGGVNTYQQQYLGYSGPVGEAPYSLPGLLPRPAPPASSYYTPYQPPTAPAPTYPLQFTPPAQSGAFGSQFLSSQLQVAAAVQQMQQQYRAPMQQQYAPPQPRPPPAQQLKSPLHEHANGFAPLCEAASPTPKSAKPQKPPHSPPQHKYHTQPPPAAPQPPHTPHHHQHHQQHQQHHHHQQHAQQMMGGGNNGRSGGNGGGGAAVGRGGMMAPRYPAPIQRPHAPALPLFRAPPAPQQQQVQQQQVQRPHQHVAQPPQQQRQNVYYQHHQRNGAGVAERTAEPGEVAPAAEEPAEVPPPAEAPTAPEVKAE